MPESPTIPANRSLSRSVEAGGDVHGCLCFVGGQADKPPLRKLSLDGYPLLYPRQLVKLLNRPGELGADEIRELAATLAAALPPA